jgi:RNA polymerase sigma-70 factor (ECF subfamily)
MDAADDFALLEAWRAGDAGAGRELFARHFDAVYRFFRNKVDDAAEDLVQQTFMAVVQAKEVFRGDASFRTFLFVVARKRLYSWLRERTRRPEAQAIGSTSIADVAGASPSRAAADREEHRVLLEALRRLPVEMQTALELFYWEDLSVAEIGEVLDVPVGTVKSRLQRARAQLDRIIAELATSEELRRSTIGGLERWARELQAVARRGPADP